MYRDHFGAHCGMEVVLPDGEIMRTGMGAVPGADTWAQFKYGFGAHVDGLFAQANFGIVTKMGFWMTPRPEHFLSCVVKVPRYRDIVPLVEGINYLEDSGMIGYPRYESPLQLPPNGADPELLKLHAQPGGGTPDQYEKYAQQKGLEYWSVVLNYYGPLKSVRANWEYTRERFSGIKDVRFEELESFPFPISPENKAKARHLVALGIPNMAIFSTGARSDLMPTPADGHIWYAPVMPRTGEALILAHQVLGEAFAELGIPSPIGPYSTPRTWIYRSFVLLMNFSISRSDPAHNQKIREVFKHLIEAAAKHGWVEYRIAPAFQDLLAGKYSYNNNILLRFQQILKDAVDPNGIISPGRGGIWPKHLREAAK